MTRSLQYIGVALLLVVLVAAAPTTSIEDLVRQGNKAVARSKYTDAVKLYELGRLSSGAAARLAGIPRVLFLSRLADYGVDTFRLSEDDLRREVRLA